MLSYKKRKKDQYMKSLKGIEIKISKQLAIRKAMADKIISIRIKAGVNPEHIKMITTNKSALIEAIRDEVITAIKFYNRFNTPMMSKIAY
jgi:hypothetical protein